MSDFELSQDSSDSQNGSAATMEEFLNQEEASTKRIAHGDIIDGVVVRVNPDHDTIDDVAVRYALTGCFLLIEELLHRRGSALRVG